VSQKKILIVDDAQLVRNIYRTLLEEAGFQVVEAADYDQAIGLMDDSIDLALLDVVLKKKSGLDVLKHIRHHFPTCPVIMISAHANKKNILAALNEGAVQYFEKILSPVELLHSVKNWLSYRDMQQENIRLQDYKATVEALRDSEAHLAAILDSALEAIISADENQSIILFNNAAQTLFGYKEEEVLGKHLEILFPETFHKERRQHANEFANDKNSPEPWKPRRDISGVKKNGEAFPLEGSISRTSINGKHIVTAILHDASERSSRK